MSHVKVYYPTDRLINGSANKRRRWPSCLCSTSLLALCAAIANIVLLFYLNRIGSPITAYPSNQTVIRNVDCTYWKYEGSYWPPSGLLSVKGDCRYDQGVYTCTIEECLGAQAYNTYFIVMLTLQSLGVAVLCLHFTYNFVSLCR